MKSSERRVVNSELFNFLLSYCTIYIFMMFCHCFICDCSRLAEPFASNHSYEIKAILYLF